MSYYELQYKIILNKILSKGMVQPTRTGLTKALFNEVLTVSIAEYFPLITGRLISFNNIITEAKWMLKGFTTLDYLHENGVHIWDKWADENGDLGPVYGFQLIKQWGRVIEAIAKEPGSRRHIINLWDYETLPQQKLPPCYTTLKFYTTWWNKCLNLTVFCRSTDAAVGLPHDIAVLALFLHYAVDELSSVHNVKLDVGDITMLMSDVHINSENQQACKDYIDAKSYYPPKLVKPGYSLTSYVTGPPIKMVVKP